MGFLFSIVNLLSFYLFVLHFFLQYLSSVLRKQ